MTLTDFYVVLGRAGRRPTRSSLIDQLRECMCPRNREDAGAVSPTTTFRTSRSRTFFRPRQQQSIIPEFDTKSVKKNLSLTYYRGKGTSLPINQLVGSIGRA